MTPNLKPALAGAIMDGVYALQRVTETRPFSDLIASGVRLGCEDHFDVQATNGITGRSGSLFWKTLSGFGYIARGKPGTEFAQDALLAARGTVGSKIGPDWRSNYNISLQRGPSGNLVHGGFNEIWNSFSLNLEEFLQANPEIRRVHCVGHSLGGALATLSADFITSRGRVAASLYTFGSPRVGTERFANELTQRLGADQIFRVYHASDPVPMIWLFPFFHVPFGADGIEIANSMTGFMNPDAHGRQESYLPAMEKGDWQSLRSASAKKRAIQDQAEFDRVMALAMLSPMGSTAAVYLIGKALAWLVKQALVVTIGIAFTTGVTLLDRLAWLVGEGAAKCAQIAEGAKTLMQAIGRFLGRKLQQVGEVGIAFVRWVLGLLWNKLAELANRALDKVFGGSQ